MIDSSTLDMFRRVTLTEAGHLVLPEMSRDLYDKCQKVLVKMGFKWDGRKSVRAHVMQGDLDPAAALAEMIETGLIPNGNQFAYWPSSSPLVDAVIDVAVQLGAEFREILEPSAGEGAIVNVARQIPSVKAITAVEVQSKRAAALRKIGGVGVIEFDFLRTVPTCTFDTILMNPPFAVEGAPLAYVEHIEHAMQFLAPGGVLSTVVPAGFRFRADSKIAKLRAVIEQHSHVIEDFGSDAAGMKTGVYMLVVGMRKA